MMQERGGERSGEGGWQPHRSTLPSGADHPFHPHDLLLGLGRLTLRLLGLGAHGRDSSVPLRHRVQELCLLGRNIGRIDNASRSDWSSGMLRQQ